MSILIKGMEMPKRCRECRFDSAGWCFATDRIDNRTRFVKFATYDSPQEWCPLVPVPPHGALMDRDDFFAVCPELVDGYKRITDDLVIIPAEEGEK